MQSFNVLQQRLNRKSVTPKLMARIPRASARLRPAGRRRRRSARASVRRAPRAARSLRRSASTSRASTSRRSFPFNTWDDTRRRARRSGLRRRGRRCRSGRRHHAQAPRRALRAGPPERPVVEVEARPLHRRRRADVCPARLAASARRTIPTTPSGSGRDGDGRRRAGAGRQGLFRLHRRGAARRSTATCAATPSSGSARCARSCTSRHRGWCWRSRSKVCSARPGTSPGLAMRFPAHQPAALGQAAGRGRPAGDAGADACRTKRARTWPPLPRQT